MSTSNNSSNLFNTSTPTSTAISSTLPPPPPSSSQQQSPPQKENQQQQQQQQQSFSSPSTSSSQQDMSFAFFCKVDNVRLVYTLLQTLLPKSPPGTSSSSFASSSSNLTNGGGGGGNGSGSVIASMKITSKAIKVVVGTKSSQGVVLLESGLFQEYFFDPDRSGHNGEIQFGINLNVLIDCLTLLTKDLAQFVALQIGYQGNGSKLCLMLEDGDIQCECCLSTFDHHQYAVRTGLASNVSNNNNFTNIGNDSKISNNNNNGIINYNNNGISTDIFSDFLSTEIVFTAEVASDFLKGIFASMDWDSDTLQLYVSPVQPNFRMSTENKSTAAISEVEYSRTDDQFFSTFNCRRSQVWRYNARHIYSVFNALANASYTRIRINSVGALRMEHIINLDERNTGFAVFTVLSNKTFLDSGGCDIYNEDDEDVNINVNNVSNEYSRDIKCETTGGYGDDDGNYHDDGNDGGVPDNNNNNNDPYDWTDDNSKRSVQPSSPELN